MEMHWHKYAIAAIKSVDKKYLFGKEMAEAYTNYKDLLELSRAFIGIMFMTGYMIITI